MSDLNYLFGCFYLFLQVMEILLQKHFGAVGLPSFMLFQVWQYGLWSIQTGGKKFERFLPKNQHTQRKLLNFVFWINGELSKSAKI